MRLTCWPREPGGDGTGDVHCGTLDNPARHQAVGVTGTRGRCACRGEEVVSHGLRVDEVVVIGTRCCSHDRPAAHDADDQEGEQNREHWPNAHAFDVDGNLPTLIGQPGTDAARLECRAWAAPTR